MEQFCSRSGKTEQNLDDVTECHKSSQERKRFRWTGSSLFRRKTSKPSIEERDNEEKSCRDDSSSEATEGCSADVKAVEMNTVLSTEEQQEEQEEGVSEDYYSCDSRIVSVETEKAHNVKAVQMNTVHSTEEQQDEQEDTCDRVIVPTEKPHSRATFGYTVGLFRILRWRCWLGRYYKMAVKTVIKTGSTRYLRIPDHPDPVPQEIALMIQVNKGYKYPQIMKILGWFNKPLWYAVVIERHWPCINLFKVVNLYDGRINEVLARHIMGQAILAAVVCSERGVLHNNIKLENLLMDMTTLEVKLANFGAAECLKETPYRRYPGSKKYMPPEFKRTGEYHGNEATVWSLGVVLYRIVCGHFPKKHIQQCINDNVWTNTDLSEECCHLIHCCLQQEPRKRIELNQILSHDWFKK